jgi:hypothetical protein
MRILCEPSGNFVNTEWNRSNVALRAVGADEKGNLKSGRVKYGHESHGTQAGE